MLPRLSARPATQGEISECDVHSGVGADPRDHRQAHARSSSIAKFAIPDDRGVAHIDDLQDAIAGHRSARARIGPRVGAFRKPADPALTSLPRPAGSAHCKPPLSIFKICSGYESGANLTFCGCEDARSGRTLPTQIRVKRRLRFVFQQRSMTARIGAARTTVLARLASGKGYERSSRLER
jgi:hypothetical protein